MEEFFGRLTEAGNCNTRGLAMTRSTGNAEFSGHLFSGSLAVLGLFVTILAGLLATYSEVQNVSWLAERYELLIWCALAAVLLSAGAASLSLARLWGVNVPVALPAGLICALIAAFFFGSIIAVITTISGAIF